jgi:hypothetical protein
LVQAGYQLVELTWPNRWSNGIDDEDLTEPAEVDVWEGQATLACRVATMVQWIVDNLHVSGTPLCATGQSGGASQIAYTLTYYGMDSLWDAVVLTSGPTHSDLPAGCWSICPPATFGQPCHNDRAKCGIDWAYGNPYDSCDDLSSPLNYGPCQDQGAGSLEFFRYQSIAVDPPFGSWNYFYPTTSVHFIEGGLDSGSAPWQLQRYLAELAAAGTTTSHVVVPSASHNVPEDAFGADQIFADLTTNCVIPQ